MELASFLIGTTIGVGGVVIGFIQWRLARKQRAEAWEIARESGAFDKATIELFFWGVPIPVTGGMKTQIWLLHPGTREDIAVVEMCVSVVSMGKRVCENPVLMIQTMEGCIAKDRHIQKPIVTPGVMKKDIKRKVVQVGHQRQVSYRIPNIPPNARFDLQEQIGLPITVGRRIDVPLHFADGTKGDATVSLGLSLVFSIAFLSNNDAIAGRIELLTVPQETLDDDDWEAALLSRVGELMRRDNASFLRCGLIKPVVASKQGDKKTGATLYVLGSVPTDAVRIRELSRVRR